MKPAGVILTFMKWWSKWFLFNLGLFVWQVVFLVIGKIYGKIKVRWRKVWRAAQVCHVRLCLKKMLPDYAEKHISGEKWQYINFGYPKAELQSWRMDMIDGKRFRYYDPTFDPSPEFIGAMIQYAYDQVDKPYDVPQLASYAVNLAIWIVCPWTWGREIIEWFNKPGGHESCSSGVTADLRWAEYGKFLSEQFGVEWRNPDYKAFKVFIGDKMFFKGYDTAMVPPCLYELDENWRER